MQAIRGVRCTILRSIKKVSPQRHHLPLPSIRLFFFVHLKGIPVLLESQNLEGESRAKRFERLKQGQVGVKSTGAQVIIFFFFSTRNSPRN